MDYTLNPYIKSSILQVNTKRKALSLHDSVFYISSELPVAHHHEVQRYGHAFRQLTVISCVPITGTRSVVFLPEGCFGLHTTNTFISYYFQWDLEKKHRKNGKEMNDTGKC